jgi:sec-independent protein translocase protein TatC
MTDEGADGPPADSETDSEEPADTEEPSESDGSYEVADGPTEDVGDLPLDPDEYPSEPADEPWEPSTDDDESAADSETEPSDDAGTEPDADGLPHGDFGGRTIPGGRDEGEDETGAEPAAADADDDVASGTPSQSELEPAGDPNRDWGPEDDEEWEDPFPDIEVEPPDYDIHEEADEAYPANPNVPDEDPAVEEADADASGAAEGAAAAAGGAAGTVGGSTATAESDGGYADPTSTTTVEQEYHDGPASDQEMPLADHIEEMVRRLGVVIVVLAVVSAIVFPFAERIINFLWFSYLPGSLAQCPANPDISQGGAACARVYNPLALIFARLKMATLAGLVVSLPVFVYETYLFMRPGLYPTERRYYLASVPTSLILATAGVAFAHFLVLPAIFTYFVYYSEGATVIAFGLTETFDLIVLMMGGFAIIFQIPLFVSLALMMGLVTRRWMARKRLYFWGAFAGLAFLFSPDPTGMAPIIVAATMIILFEGTLLLAKWTGRE